MAWALLTVDVAQDGLALIQGETPPPPGSDAAQAASAHPGCPRAREKCHTPARRKAHISRVLGAAGRGAAAVPPGLTVSLPSLKWRLAVAARVRVRMWLLDRPWRLILVTVAEVLMKGARRGSC